MHLWTQSEHLASDLDEAAAYNSPDLDMRHPSLLPRYALATLRLLLPHLIRPSPRFSNGGQTKSGKFIILSATLEKTIGIDNQALIDHSVLSLALYHYARASAHAG